MTDEAKKILDHVADWLKSQEKVQAGRSGAAGWIVGIFLTAIALLAAGFMYYRAWKQGKELAKLKHEKDVEEQQQFRDKLAKEVEQSEAKAAILRNKINASETRVAEFEEQLKELQDAATKTRNEISALEDWGAADRYLAERKNRER